MIKSMTGFGRAAGTAGGRWAVSVSVRSVNHRYLELGVRLPESFWELEQPVRTLASRHMERGKVDLSIRLRRTGEQNTSVRVNRSIASSVIPQLTLLLAELGHGVSVGVGDLVRIPGLVEVETADEGFEDAERAEILEIVRQSLEALDTMRQEEGAALAADIRSRIESIREERARLEDLIPQIRTETAENFRRRLEEIRSEQGLEVAEERIAQELALQIERGDIAEELTRLASHLDQVEKLVQDHGPAGKKLDFLAQEMLREVNTMGQKSRSVALRSVVVELKTQVERIREQVQNVE